MDDTAALPASPNEPAETPTSPGDAGNAGATTPHTAATSLDFYKGGAKPAHARGERFAVAPTPMQQEVAISMGDAQAASNTRRTSVANARRSSVAAARRTSEVGRRPSVAVASPYGALEPGVSEPGTAVTSPGTGALGDGITDAEEVQVEMPLVQLPSRRSSVAAVGGAGSRRPSSAAVAAHPDHRRNSAVQSAGPVADHGE